MIDIGKTIIGIGILLVIIGAFLTIFEKVPILGKLPGDILIKKDNITFYFPLATSILISLVVSIILYFLSKK